MLQKSGGGGPHGNSIFYIAVRKNPILRIWKEGFYVYTLSNMYLMRLPKFKVFQAAMMVLKTTWIRNFIGIFESSFKTELFFWNGRNLIIPSNAGMLANDQRTTNLLEGPGCTDGFRVVDVSHPDVYKLLISLIREASQNRNNHRCPNSMWWTKNRPRKKGNFKKAKIYTIVSTVGEWYY